MTDNVDNLIVEHLRHIRGRVDQIAEDMTDIKHRMTSLGTSMALVQRIERIEKRLELS